MVKKFTISCLATLVAVGLSGCSSQPECDDSDVKDLLTQIAKQHSWVPKKSKVKYSAFITHFKDKDIKKVGCRAKMTIDGSRSKYVEYTAQHTEDGQIYVEAMLD